MNRSLLAALAGVVLVLAWIALAATLADRLGPLPVGGQLLYYVIAGVGWVVPAWALMRWALRGR